LADSTDSDGRTIPWLRILVEGVVIVGSILLAFGIDAWWDQVQERIEEQEVLAGLDADFERNQQQLDDVLLNQAAFQSRIDRLESMSAVELAAIPPDSSGAYVRGLRGMATFDAGDGTLDAMIASGKLGVISDPGLRDRLLRWKLQVVDAEEEADDVRASAQRVVQRMADLGGPWQMNRPNGRVVAVTAVLPLADLSVLSGDPELMSRARARRFDGLVYAGVLSRLATAADSLVLEIRAQRR
jgi:hypothetical protein